LVEVFFFKGEQTARENAPGATRREGVEAENDEGGCLG